MSYNNNRDLVNALVSALNGVNGNGNYRGKKNYNNNRQGQNNDTFRSKKSGAKWYKGKGGKQDFVGAWLWRRETGLVKVSGFFTDEILVAENGSEYVVMEFKVFYQNTGVTHVEKAAFFLDSGKAHLSQCNIYISTKANNGGFCGFYSAEFKNHKPK